MRLYQFKRSSVKGVSQTKKIYICILITIKMSIMYSSALYASPIVLALSALLNPAGIGFQHEYKMAILFGLLPALVKMISMTGEAQISTKVILGASVATIVSHLLLRIASSRYKQAIQKPEDATRTEVILSWGGISLVYTLVTLLILFFLGDKRFNNAAKVAVAAPKVA